MTFFFAAGLACLLPCSAFGEDAPASGEPDGQRVCTPLDTRVLSANAATARLLIPGPAGGCTGFIINAAPADEPTDRCMLTAGHCMPLHTQVEFEPIGPSIDPVTGDGCAPQPPPLAKRFDVNPAQAIFLNLGPGNDYAVFRTFRNATTGLTVYEEQGAKFPLAGAVVPTVPATKYGYGVDGSPFFQIPDEGPCTCRILDLPDAGVSQMQQTSTGVITAVTGTFVHHDLHDCQGDSGEPIVSDGRAVAIGTHGACAGAIPVNGGTAVTNPGLLDAIATICPVPADTDHYMCYSMRDRTRDLVPVPPPPTPVVDLRDQLDKTDSAFALGAPNRFCVPTSKNRAPIVDDETHQKSYWVKRLTGKHVQPTVFVRNQFGALELHLGRETDLFVPTTKDLLAVPGLPDPSSPAFEHYKCYRASPRGARFPRDIVAELEDQFGFQKVQVRKPRRFCLPVSKNGEPINDSLRHLVCYGVRPLIARPHPLADAFTNNQFRPELVEVRTERELCVPSFKTDVQFPCCQ